MLAAFVYVTYMNDAMSDFQEVGPPRPFWTTRDVKSSSTAIPHLRPTPEGDMPHPTAETSGRSNPMPRGGQHAGCLHQIVTVDEQAHFVKKSSGLRGQPGQVEENGNPGDTDLTGSAVVEQDIDGKANGKNMEPEAIIVTTSLRPRVEGGAAENHVDSKDDAKGQQRKKERAGAPMKRQAGEKQVGSGLTENSSRGADPDREGPWAIMTEGEVMEEGKDPDEEAKHQQRGTERTQDDNDKEMQQVSEGRDRDAHPEKKPRELNNSSNGMQNDFDGKNMALMQRRKRGRRRRRYRGAEEARRAANRARWTVRGTPSRAPPARTRTSSTRAFPPAPWSRRSAPAEEEQAVCVEEPESEAAGSTAPPGGRPAGEAATIPGLDDLDPRIRWWSDIIGLTNPMNSTEGLTVLAPNTTTTVISNLQDHGGN